MGDMGDVFRALKEDRKIRRQKRLAEFVPCGRWTRHTDYHYSTALLGERLDYWPSSTRFFWRGKVRVGDVLGFIKNREAGQNE